MRDIIKEDRSNTHSVGSILKSILPYAKKYKWIFVLDLLCAALTAAADLILPIIIRYITQLATNDLAALTITLVVKIIIFLVILRIVDVVAQYYMTYVGHVVGARIETDMRRDLFSHLQKLSFSYYDNNKIGQIVGRISNDLFAVTEFVHHGPEEIMIGVLKIVIAFAVLININVSLTLIIFAIFPFMLCLALFLNGKMKRATKLVRIGLGEINEQTEDSLFGIRVVQSFVNENLEAEKFEKNNNRFLQAKKKSYFFFAWLQSTSRIYDAIMYISIIAFGTIWLIHGRIDVADYVAYLLYISTLLAAIRQIVLFSEQFQQGITGIERFLEVMEEPIEIHDKPDAVELTDVKGQVDFEHVYFQYDDSSSVLSDISFTVKPGENVAIIGSSGIGKSTLCSLIPRFYEVNSGRILIDGKDISDVTLDSLRKNIGVVQQDSYLFGESIKENIRYGKPDATDKEIIEAAKLARINDYIVSLPDGYNTFVGERGVKLSGGQKQRINIARIFLKNPPIVILDEATSALDTETEKQVQLALDALAKGRTTFTIAHRLTTIENASSVWKLTTEGITVVR